MLEKSRRGAACTYSLPSGMLKEFGHCVMVTLGFNDDQIKLVDFSNGVFFSIGNNGGSILLENC